MKEAILPDFSINIASFFCKESGSDSLGLYFFLILQEESVFVGAVAEFDCFDLVVTIMNDAGFGCTVQIILNLNFRSHIYNGFVINY